MISVVVPAYECANMLSHCLQGLLANDLERSHWELIGSMMGVATRPPPPWHGSTAADARAMSCGAIRVQAFHAVGGFDASRSARPQIEDIDLGYRLFDAGFRSMLDPSIQGTHLKRWTLLTMLRTDLMDRAIPWMALLRSRGDISVDGTLNLRTAEKILTVVTSVGVLLLLEALRTRRFDLLGLSVVCLVTVVFANMPHFLWFARLRSPLFALRAIPLRLLHYVVCAVGGAVGMFVTPRPRLENASAGRTMQTRGAPGIPVGRTRIASPRPVPCRSLSRCAPVVRK